MKVVFLDIDGVLVTDTCHVWEFSREAIENLEVILESSGCQIVISSSWAHRGRDTVIEKFQKNGFDLEPHLHEDWTSQDWSLADRRDEVCKWLSKHPEVTGYAVIDDMDCSLPHQVLTNPMFGIADLAVEQVLEMLEKPRFQLE